MSSRAPGYREIPFNYTSADDARVVSLVLGDGAWERLQELRSRRVTGRSARLLMRFLGELFIHQRNAYLYKELLTSPKRQARLFDGLGADLAGVRSSVARTSSSTHSLSSHTLPTRPTGGSTFRSRSSGPMPRRRSHRSSRRSAVLTNCPSCLTGLKRNEDLGVEARHVAVEAVLRLSPDWRALLAERVRKAACVRF